MKEVLDFCRGVVYDFKKKNYAVLGVLIVVLICIYFFQKEPPSNTTNFNVSGDGAVGIGGDNKGSVTTKVIKNTQDPVVTYKLLSESQLEEDGLYHADIEVTVGYIKNGKLHHRGIWCEEKSSREQVLFMPGVYPIPGNANIWTLQCKAQAPLEEGKEYFEYEVLKPAANE